MTERMQNAADAGPGPHYLALRDHLAGEIAQGALAVGARLPSERQLQLGSGAARGTVREALFQLEAEGLIYRRDRSGWYVSPPPVVYDPTRWAGFMAYVAEQGRVPTTETLGKQSVAASAADAAVFGCAIGTPLFALDRRRAIDGRPVLVERILVDPVIAPDLLDEGLDGSLTAVLTGRYGVRVVRNHVEMRPCALIKDVARALGVASGTPGLLVVRRSFDAGDRIIEYDHEYWRHDAIRVLVEVRTRD
ncbi:UTRA domain-containing protein [Sphingomonas echinoides]|uniref:UTRA domain-containing protein n=1 Tax=Sphingomonas echinoides TaxID=59803 RepID=A0ABU4PPC0_9SPHN|nr:UTRA domain-containing protein [Sphingomonas echinoides]MDX5985986.1 UTRA domain-containing protein [Sphingomonas echinoides]